MKNETVYQWVFEELDEHGDIIDPEFTDTLITGYHDTDLSESRQLALVLMRGNDSDCEVERAYAYVDPNTMTLPDEFDDGRKVPSRFNAKLTKWAKGAA